MIEGLRSDRFVSAIFFSVFLLISFLYRKNLEISPIFLFSFGLLFFVLLSINYKASVLGIVFLIPFQFKGVTTSAGVISVTDIAIVLILFLFIIKSLLRREKFHLSSEFFILLLFIIISFIPTFISQNPVYMRFFLRFLITLAAILVVAKEVKEKLDLLLLMKNLTAVILGVTIYGIYEFICLKGSIEIIKSGMLSDKDRVVSVFNQPNSTAIFIVIFLPLAIMLFQYTKRNYYMHIFLLCIIGVILTFSRAGILLLIFELIFLPIKKFYKYLILTSLIILLILFSTIITNRAKSVDYRLENFKAFPSMMQNSGFIGSGLGSYPDENRRINPHKRQNYPWASHNLYLKLLVETGIVGFVAFIIFLFLILNRILIRFSGPNNSVSRVFLVMYFILLLSQLFTSQLTGLHFWIAFIIFYKIDLFAEM